ncbi:glutamine--fructose-6-phosphate aminotransferase [Methyloceanibacter methanicus]|uniref:Glutamine--fructose-6-phosphate aminotransferase [isomerizing] n=1 Tax=Methyloceanibacter methanicus TaxID=1774968 RepID=A0A1E3VZK4_9HYPH|nr:glutamine--fructose-6-phosphate transaminase (isomerizing) [Methyloceanibacter methanicus]ODR98995.1 glutamine--fructose-6-phosphate aminotransferase [Methyloceanibacter methanicus]
MCGIVGVLGKGPVAELLVDALKRLEYRGYDSTGVATVGADRIERRRAEGKLRNLESLLATEPLSGDAGIGHTRWATHGKPSEANAHPHMTDDVAVVHNGIIENFRELKAELEAEGAPFTSDTDTEVIAHLITRELRAGKDPIAAVRKVLSHLQGAFALAMIFKGYDDLMVAARQGSPLAIGYGDGEMFVGSDAIALAPFTDDVAYLEDGDWAVITREGVTIHGRDGSVVDRTVVKSHAAGLMVDKGNFRHFMAKEIHEQPEVVGHTLAHYLDIANYRVALPDLPFDFADVGRLSLSACGTAFYACFVAKYWFERWAKLPVDVDIASEFRYREVAMEPGGAALFVSQSGETADTLASLRYCRAQNQHVLSVVNVRESSIARESDGVLPTLGGPEVGVASTKAFTCQLTVLACLAIAAGKARGTIGPELETELVKALVEVPRHMAEILRDESLTKTWAHSLSKARDVLYLGRGTSYPIALEGALKLKEISYIHAEGYAAGELKHGPIALIDESVPVIVIAPQDELFDKTVSNMQEVAAREGKIILVSDANPASVGCAVQTALPVPTVHRFVSPLVYAVPIQLIAYYTAVFMGTDVDQPRNLAKSVTVE